MWGIMKQVCTIFLLCVTLAVSNRIIIEAALSEWNTMLARVEELETITAQYMLDNILTTNSRKLTLGYSRTGRYDWEPLLQFYLYQMLILETTLTLIIQQYVI